MADSIQTLTGFALFIRQRAGIPTAITIDLDRRPLLPDKLRPWVCRVSVQLLKPGKDGVAEDQLEIDALGDLSEVMLGAMEVLKAEFVVMTTAAGIRSWIMYMASEIGVDGIVQQAFAGQQDYHPTVGVESDPLWRVYLSLYPTEQEEHAIRVIRVRRIFEREVTRYRALTTVVVQSLQERGDDLRPRKLDFSFTFPSAESRDEFANFLSAEAFAVEAESGPNEEEAEGPYTLSVSRVEEPTVPRVFVIERYLIDRVTRRGGSYVGWGCLMQPSAAPQK